MLEAALGTPMSPRGFWGEEIPFFLVSPSLASPVRGVWLREAEGKNFHLDSVPGPGYDNLGKGLSTIASPQTQPGLGGGVSREYPGPSVVGLVGDRAPQYRNVGSWVGASTEVHTGDSG